MKYEFKKNILSLVIVVAYGALSGCGPKVHKVGDNFYADIWTTGNRPNYYLAGTDGENEVYLVTPESRERGSTSGYGIEVNAANKKVVKRLSKEEADLFLSNKTKTGNKPSDDNSISGSESKLETTERKTETDENVCTKDANQNPEISKTQYGRMMNKLHKFANHCDEDKALTPEQEEKNKARLIAKVDSVAQVLNFSSGCDDDHCPDGTWVPVDGQKCVYNYKKFNTMGSVEHLVSAVGLIGGIPSQVNDGQTIDFNKISPSSISISEGVCDINGNQDVFCVRVNGEGKQLTSTASAAQNQSMDMAHGGYMGMMFGLNTEKNAITSSIRGENLSRSDRIQKGWNLIFRKYCKGGGKEF